MPAPLFSEGTALNAHIGKGYELTSTYTYLPNLSPIGGVTSAGGTETYRWVQGGCTDGTYYYCCMTTDNTVAPAKGVILKYDLATQELVKTSAEVNMGHMNDAVYNPDNHTILISELKTKQNVSDDYTYTNKHYVVDPDTLTVKDTVEFPASGTIAYDDVRNRYICSTNSYFYFYNQNFELVDQVAITNLFTDYGTGSQARQGITCDEKYIYQLTYWQSASDSTDIRCEIVVYDVVTGAYVQRIPLNMGREVENIFIWNDAFYIVCNNLTWTGAACYRVEVQPQS